MEIPHIPRVEAVDAIIRGDGVSILTGLPYRGWSSGLAVQDAEEHGIALVMYADAYRALTLDVMAIQDVADRPRHLQPTHGQRLAIARVGALWVALDEAHAAGVAVEVTMEQFRATRADVRINLGLPVEATKPADLHDANRRWLEGEPERDRAAQREWSDRNARWEQEATRKAAAQARAEQVVRTPVRYAWRFDNAELATFMETTQ